MAGESLIGNLAVLLSMDTAAFEQGSSHAQKLLSRTQREFEKLGNRMQKIGRSLSTWVTLPVLGAGAAVLKLAGDFETGMGRVAISTQAPAEQLAALRELAIDIGAKTTKSASEAADAMDMLAKAGMGVEDILNGGARAVVALAEAAGSELDPAAAAITDVLKQFKKTTADLPNIINNITGAVNQSKFSFDDFQGGMAQAGGVASGAGVEFEEFTAALAGTAAQFASGSDAGTSLKTFIMRLAPDTEKATAAMEKATFNAFNLDGSLKPLAVIAQDLHDKFGKLSELDRANAFKDMFGTDAIRTAIGLMEMGGKGFEAMQAKIAATDASAQAAMRMKGFNAEMEKLWGAVETLAIKIGDSGLLTVVTNLVSGFAEWIDWMSKAHPETLKIITVVAALAAAVGPLVFVFGGFFKAVAFLLPLIVKLGPALKVLQAGFVLARVAALATLPALLPFLLPLAAMAAAVTAVYFAWKYWPQITAYVVGLYNKVKTYLADKLAAVLDHMKQKVLGLIAPFRALYNAVVGHSYIPDMVDQIGAHMRRLDAEMVKPARKAAEKTAEVMSQLQALLARLFPEAADKNAFLADMATLERALKRGKISAAEYAASLSRLQSEGFEYERPELNLGDPVGDLERDLGQRNEEWMERWRRAFEEKMVKPAEDGTARMIESFANMARDVIGSLRGMVSAFKSGDIFGGLMQLLDVAAQVAASFRGMQTGNSSSSGFNFGGFRAGGGPVVPGRTYVVGEDGPEFLNVGARGYVTPTRRNSGAMRLQVVPSPYFDLVVDGRSARIAGPLAVGAMEGGSARGQAGVYRRAERIIP